MSRAGTILRLVERTRDIRSPIQAILSTEKNVIDHVETCSDRILPPTQTTLSISSCGADFCDVVTTEVLTTARKGEPVVKLVLCIGRRTPPGRVIFCIGATVLSIRTSGVAEDGVEARRSLSLANLGAQLPQEL